jgi:TM2 domain-containing membrane protein YozV
VTEPHDLALRQSALSAEIERLRADIAWVNDADLRSLEPANPGGAWALSLLFGGGGQVMNGDVARGAGLIALWIGTFVLSGWLGPIALWLTLAVMVGGSVHAFTQARAINRYLAARAEQHQLEAGVPSALRLVQAMGFGGAMVPVAAHAAPLGTAGVAGPLVQVRMRLEKLKVLRNSGVIDDAEHREQRIEVLSELVEVGRERLDEVLYELLPLIQQGTITREDVEFVKRMGGRGP